MKIEQNETPLGEHFSVALRAFVENFHVPPPKNNFTLSPCFSPLTDAIKARRCVINPHHAFALAAEMLASARHADGHLFILGYGSASDARRDVDQRVRELRNDPYERRCRGIMWRYSQREKLLIADLIAPSPPKCRYASKVWHLLRENYVPAIEDLGGSIVWKL